MLEVLNERMPAGDYKYIANLNQLSNGMYIMTLQTDSTIKSNISVGLPLDLLIYPKDDLKTDHLLVIDEKNEYFKMIHETWGKRLRQVFSEIEDPVW